MTAPRPEIQRFTEQLEGSNMVVHKKGEFVDYWDHLRAVTLAQADKLEEMVAGQTGHMVDRIKVEIERLRKEMKG